jgi:hypothetical protein
MGAALEYLLLKRNGRRRRKRISIRFVLERVDDGPARLSGMEAAGDLPQSWARM